MHKITGYTCSDLFRGGGEPGDIPPPLKFANYHNNTCNFCLIINLFTSESSLRSSLRGHKFQNFPGGACPQTPLV